MKCYYQVSEGGEGRKPTRAGKRGSDQQQQHLVIGRLDSLPPDRPLRHAHTMWFYNYRQKLQLLVIVFFTFIAFAAANDAWIPWATLVIFLSLILLVDLLFLDAAQFQYNPDYKNWVRAVDPKY